MRERQGGRTKQEKNAISMYFFAWENNCQDGFLTVSAGEDAVSLRKNARVL